MELNYAAYNPVTNEMIPGVPSNFMEPPFDDPTLTAEAELLCLGFEATAYNYPDENASHFAAHTIGHRTITNYTTEETNNELLDNNSVDNISDMDMDTGTHRTYKISEYDLGILVLNPGSNSQGTDNNPDSRQLVVITVRGSVTNNQGTVL